MAQTSGGNDRFGFCFVNSAEMNYSAERIEERYQRATQASASWTRWPLYWPSIETASGSFDYSAQDTVVVKDLEYGLKINAILMNTPDWCATAGALGVEMPRVERKPPFSCYFPGGECPVEVGIASSAISPPQGLGEPVFNDGTDIPGPGKSINSDNYWARFVYTTVNRYRPGSQWGQDHSLTPEQGIRHWEMWNEPDFPGVFWDGTIAEYYRLLKVGHLAAKAADSQAVILMGGLAHWHNPAWFPQLLDLMEDDTEPPVEDFGPYFDVLPWHWYSTPYHLYEKTLWARGQLSARGFSGKKIWVNETNVPVWDDYPGSGTEGDYFATMEEQAAFIIQAASWAFAADVERIFAFQLYDDCVRPNEAFGLVRNFSETPCDYANQHPQPGTTRPSYTAYQTAATYMVDLASAQRVNHSTWEELSFFDGFGQRLRVIWATASETVQADLPAYDDHATLIQQDGTPSTIYPEGGFYHLSLPGATNYNNPGLLPDCMIGGKPHILLENLVVGLIGKVYDSRAEPIAGATVVTTDGTGTVRRTRTRLDSSYRLLPLPKDTYQAQAQATNFASWPARRGIDLEGQDLAREDFYLPARDNLAADGGFEGELSAHWVRSGSTAAVITTTASSGSGAVLLGQDFKSDDPPLDPGGNSTISQTITIPAGMERPILSFMYRLETEETWQRDGFEVLIIYQDNEGHLRAYYLPNNDPQHYWQATDWTHEWFDLSEQPGLPSLSGQTLDLYFNLWQSSVEKPTLAWVDEVSVGSIPAYRYSSRFPLVQGGG